MLICGFNFMIYKLVLSLLRCVKIWVILLVLFVETDPKNFTGLWRDYLRIRVTLDVTKPLKRRKKIGRIGKKAFWVNFKYEHVPTFCFICGIMRHADAFCPKLFEMSKESIVRPFGIWMKAVPRR